MPKIQFNQSTLKVSYDAGTSKVQTVTFCDCGGNVDVKYYDVTFTNVDAAVNGTHRLERVANCYWFKLTAGVTYHLWLKQSGAGNIGLQANDGGDVFFNNYNDDISECQESGSNIPNNAVGYGGTGDFAPV